MFIMDMPSAPASELPVIMAQAGNGKGGNVVLQDLTPLLRLATNNLLTEEGATDGIVADANPSQGSLIAAGAQGQYDVAYSICQPVAPANYAVDFVAVANSIIPAMASANYFSNRGISLNPSDSITVAQIDAPKHGVLEHKNVYGAYLYKPNKDYFGGDRMIFSVEVKGKVFKVIYSVDVVKNPDGGSPSCPDGLELKELPTPASGRIKHGSFDILELPNATQYDAETLAQQQKRGQIYFQD